MKSSATNTRPILVAYVLTVALVIVASLLPEQRIWGLNWLAYQSVWAILAAGILVTAAFLAVLMRPPSNSIDVDPDWSFGKFWLAASLMSALLIAMTLLFPSRSFFGGDGYQLISILGTHQIPGKIWNRGTAKIVSAIYGALAEHSHTQPVETYRVLSISSGVLFLITLILTVPKIEDRSWKRILLFAGLVSGGYMLNFWGYAEYYAPLILLSAVFLLLGLLHAQGKISLIWSFVAFVAACAVHLVALAFLPALIYLGIRDSKYVLRLRHMSMKTGLFSLISVIIVGGAIYWLALASSVSLRYTLLPILPNAYADRVGAILSISHLIDYLNLLLLLCPGLIVLAFTLWSDRSRKQRRSTASEFLVISSASALLAALVIDPRLGMARDWDLLSFAGLPLTLLAFKTVLDRCSIGRAVTGTLLAAVLGITILGLRVVVQNEPDIAATHYKDYLELDPKKTINGRMVLIDYYDKQGDTLRANQERKERSTKFPELALNDQVLRLVDQGQFRQSLQMSRHIIQLNPQYVNAYFNLGGSFYSLGQYDSARYYLEIADAMNPFNAQNAAMLGGVYMRQGQFEKAENYLDRALKMDSTRTDAMAALISIYITQGRLASAATLTEKLGKIPDVAPQLLLSVGAWFAQRGTYGEAVKALHRSLELGIDSSVVDSFTAHFPAAAPYLKPVGRPQPDSLNR